MLLSSKYSTIPLGNQRPSARRSQPAGTVLLIVLVVLSIFASIGLAFILYATSEERSSSSFRASADFRAPDLDPEMAFSLFLQQLIFDCKDDGSGVYSALRGHSLLRNMYGLNYTVDAATGMIKLAPDPRPFNGTGRLHWKYGDTGAPVANLVLTSGTDDFKLINYTLFPQDGFARHPERLGTTPAVSLTPGGVSLPYKGGFNPPYTAVDLNCMALAAITPEGKVLTPSFHRDYTGISLDPTSPTFQWWNTDVGAPPWLKYTVLRPRPADHKPPTVLGRPLFPPPEDKGGDVRNRPAGWPNLSVDANNDSVWLYTGAPVMTLPDGRKYTVLFAPLIFDLDSRLNIHVAGNNKGPGGVHASSQGWGGWEINLSQVLSGPASELTNLFVGATAGGGGRPRAVGKFDYQLKAPQAKGANSPTLASVQSGQSLPYSRPRFYSQLAFNPYPNSTTPPSVTLPGPYKFWPVYSGYDTQATLANLATHPLYYNPVTQAAGSRVFPPSEMHKLLRVGDTNSDALLGDLWQLLPQNLADLKKRGMITTLSFDRREPGLTPWLWNAGTAGLYRMTASGKPSAAPLASPSLNTPNVVGEYSPDWRGLFPTLQAPALRNPLQNQRDWPNLPGVRSVDLNRSLVDVNSATLTPTDLGKILDDRKQLATEIYEILIKVTGAPDPFLPANPPPPPITSADYEVLRYLAQLAVNIVDFIDADDIITPLNWGKLGRTNYTGRGAWVYGTELPNVLINEVYCQYSNDEVNDPGFNPTPPTFPLGTASHATYYNVDVWAELCNPFKPDPALRDGGTAKLFRTSQSTSYPAYRLVVSEKNGDRLRENWNTDGRPFGTSDGGEARPDPNRIVGPEFASKPTISPLNEAFNAMPDNQGRSNGFYVVGPKDALGNRVPFPASTVPPLPPAYKVPKETIDAKAMRFKVPNSPIPAPPTVLLQRLACPYLPPNPDESSASYNPYVTVDFFEVPNDGTRKGMNPASSKGPLVGVLPGPQQAIPLEQPLVFEQRKAYGRVKPYVAKVLESQADVSSTDAVAQTTFFYHNKGTGSAANFTGWPPTPQEQRSFEWLIHLDRNLVSPLELLHVSGYSPHKLMQQFDGTKIAGYEDTFAVPPTMVGHQAPWFDEGARLYRFFEFVQTKPLQAGYALGDRNSTRIPGKININTIWGVDPVTGQPFQEIFNALCDPKTIPEASDVGTLWTQFLRLRNPTLMPGPTDQYMMPLSAGVVPPSLPPPAPQDLLFPSGMGIGNTILGHFRASNGTQNKADLPRLFVPPSLRTDPAVSNYKRYELLTKIFNNITTRSNCFAMWVTVGFFEVNEVDTSGRIYLGQELGRADGKNVRHKMFAIIDRSMLDSTTQIRTPQGLTMTYLPGLPAPGPNPAPAPPSIAESILNQKMIFNPQLSMFRELVPFFTIVE